MTRLGVYVLFALAVLTTAAVAFTPPAPRARPTIALSASTQSRRDVLLTGVLSGILAVTARPNRADAKGSTFFYDENIELVREPSQMSTGGKIDLNSAFVVRDDCSACRENTNSF
jgi:hypothetical protein